MVPSGSPSFGRVLRRHRRTLAASAAGLAVLALGLALQPAPLPTAEVVVAARDLPAGHRLTAEDLALARVPLDVAPPGSSPDPVLVIDHVLAAPVARGEPLAPIRLMGPAGSSWKAPAGTSPLPVRFTDAGAASLLSAGQRIDVLAAATGGADALEPGMSTGDGWARMVAEDVLVLAVTGVDPSGGSSLLDPAQVGQADTPLVVLAVTRPQALAIAGAQTGSHLSFTL
jgi:Flp pilus assembly protein CpaB